MSESWKQWEGRNVHGRFPLKSYLGGSDHSAVFLTLVQGGTGDSAKAAIKLLSADPADAEEQLRQWQAARELNHPNLIRIFGSGRCELDGTELLYVVMECAEENLSQILPERALTAEEARAMLPPLLKALQYVHDKGFVHGHIQPSNILAAGDQVKLSSDALGATGEKRSGAAATSAYDPPEAATGAISAAADVWQLGMTLIEVLTQRLPVWDRAQPAAPELPAAVPEPFREIAWHCLQVDARNRWTVADIADRLGMGRVESTRPASAQTEKAVLSEGMGAPRKVSRMWAYLLGIAAVLAVVFILIPRPKPSGSKSDVQATQAQPAAAENPQPAQGPTAHSPKPGPAISRDARGAAGGKAVTPEAGGDETARTNTENHGGVVQRVMPQVSPGARRTIQGKIKVRVKVDVDAAGNVANATFESAGPSKYFSRIAMEAARGWKFSPAQAGESGPREWTLQFAFSRARTEVSAVRVKR